MLPHNLPVVTTVREGTRRLVAAVDVKAKAYGVRPGLTVAHAKILAPDLQVIESDQKADEEGLRDIALACLKNYTPIAAPNPPDGIWLDITGCAHLAGSEAALLQRIVQALHQQEIRVRGAIADTFGAAHACARYGETPFSIVASGAHREALQSLPLAALRLSAKVLFGLDKLGFEIIGQLYETPRPPLARRFGIELMERLDQALGQQPEPIEPLELPEIPQVRTMFAEPVNNPDFLKSAIEQLVIELCKKLSEQGKGMRQVDCLVLRVDNQWQGMRIGASRASCAPKHIYRLLNESFDKINAGFGVEMVTLRASLTEPLSGEQLAATFGARPQEDLTGLIDVLRNRIGAPHIYKYQPVESDVPERSLRKISPQAEIKTTSWPERLPRPCRLLTPPEEVQAMALLPDYPPLHFTWRDKRYHIRRADGPERIFGEWWRRPAELLAVRDYFRVEDESGGRYWLFRSGDGTDPRTGSHKWFLHGVFG